MLIAYAIFMPIMSRFSIKRPTILAWWFLIDMKKKDEEEVTEVALASLWLTSQRLHNPHFLKCERRTLLSPVEHVWWYWEICLCFFLNISITVACQNLQASETDLNVESELVQNTNMCMDMCLVSKYSQIEDKEVKIQKCSGVWARTRDRKRKDGEEEEPKQ
ncbi:hypothetical protein ACJX0J_009157, partial [Zea mays]